MASVLTLAPSSVLPRKSELSILGALISSGAKPASDPRVRCECHRDRHTVFRAIGV